MAYCENCSHQISDQAPLCPECGHPQGVHPGVAIAAGPAGRTEGMAIASLVLGIGGFVVCPVVCSILAVIFGNQAKSKIRKDPSLEGEGMARAGVILGWIGIAIVVLVIIIIVIAAAATNGTDYDY